MRSLEVGRATAGAADDAAGFAWGLVGAGEPTAVDCLGGAGEAADRIAMVAATATASATAPPMLYRIRVMTSLLGLVRLRE